MLIDVNVQSMLARTAAGVLSDKLDTEVSIKNFHLTSDLGIYAEDVYINDKNDNPMFKVGELKVRFALSDYADIIRIKQLYISDVVANIVKYDNASSSNIAELFKSDGNNDHKEKNNDNNNIQLIIDDFTFDNGNVVVWNQTKYNPDKESMDYRYIDIDDIDLKFTDIQCKSDTIYAFIHHISANDRCGFSIDTLRSDSKVLFSTKGLILNDMILKTHATSLDMDLRFLYNDLKAYNKFVDSVKIEAEFRPSQLTLSDIGYFTNVMKIMKDTLQIEGSINGYVRDFVAEDFRFSFKDSTNFEGDIKMTGLPNFFETHILADIKELNFTYQDITQLAIPTPTSKVPLPEMLSALKQAKLSAHYEGYPNNFTTKFKLNTNLGDINVDCNLNHDLLSLSKPHYYAKISTDSLNVKDLLKFDDDAVITMSADLHGAGFTKNDADIDLDIDIQHLHVLENDFNDIKILGDFENEKFALSTNIQSEVLRTELNALANLTADVPEFDIIADVKNADLQALGLMNDERKFKVSTKINTSFKGLDPNDMYGDLYLENTSIQNDRGSLQMKDFYLALKTNPYQYKYKDLAVNCDFFDINASGVINIKKSVNTFKNYVLNHFHIKKWTEKGVKLDDDVLDFYFDMNLKNTQSLTELFVPGLYVSENTNLLINFTKDYSFYSNLHSYQISYNNFIINDFHLTNRTQNDRIVADVNFKELILREETEKNPNRLSMENMHFNFDVHSDSVLFDLSWNDDLPEDRNKGTIKAYYVADDNYHGGILRIPYTNVLINDSLWTISQNCYINFKNSRTFINDFDILSGNQALRIKGYLPMTMNDTLSVQFNKLDISSFDKLISNGSFFVDAIIDGEFKVAGIKERLTFLSNLDINKISVNDKLIGDAELDAVWHAADTSIFIQTEITKDVDNHIERILSLRGKYYTSRNDNLNFRINLNKFNIYPLNPFTVGLVSRVEGDLDGDLYLKGSVKEPVLIGRLLLKDAACKIDYLNTYYRINDTKYVQITRDQSINFKKNLIEINELYLTDTLDNHAVAKGVITHNYLRDFNFDISASLDNFMGMNMLADDNTSFYGTAIADGDLLIKGTLDDMYIGVNAETMPGTDINIFLTSAYTVNDNFIVFKQKNSYQEQDTANYVSNQKQKTNKKFSFELNADVNENATLNIILPSNLGGINANGNGNIRLGYNTDGLSLFGDYVINDGTFSFNFQNLIKRNFQLRQGGTINWTGKVDDADMSVTGVYRTKSSLSSLGILTDSLTSSNNVNVDCILRLSDKLTNPTINFGIELPNTTDDIRNTVFSVVDTTDQAVMSQQIISLLVLGTFTYSSANMTTIGASTYYGVLTSSLSSWLSQISKDFDVGVRYTPEDNITQEELEVALSTQLFDDRLTIEGNLGMYTGTNDMSQNANNIVGDVDISWKINNRLSFKVYNHSNFNTNYYTYTYENYSDYTQGVGISFSQSFDNIKEIFTRRNKKNKNKAKKSDINK